MTAVQLIVGLGNPGPEYDQTRHNAGALFVECLADRHNVSLSPEKKYFGLTGKFSHQGRDVRLLIPTTYMNRSGQAVAALANFFRIPPEAILVAHDELDMPPGVAKLKPSAKKLNALANLKNIFSKKNFMEFLKSCLKIGFLSALLWILIRDALPIMTSIPEAGFAGLGQVVGSLLKTMLINIGLAYGVIALADFAWQRFQYRKGLMMSKDEVKQEYKEMEGDPHIKHKRKHLHQEMMQEGAVNSARKATVVVTNPTHLAVALHYDAEETPLPGVVMDVFEDGGAVIADFTCSLEDSRERLARNAQWLADGLNDKLQRAVCVRVQTDDPEDRCTVEAHAGS